MASRDRQRAEFGDFQTPTGLAEEVCRCLRRKGIAPAAIVEPTCGRGQLLAAAVRAFDATAAVGYELDADHVVAARDALGALGAPGAPGGCAATIVQQDFFAADWDALLSPLPQPLLVIGNPPWVTSAKLGALGSRNLPHRRPVVGMHGLAARTGRSNFDLSEWIVLHLLERLQGKHATVAMLLKLAVARRVLRGAHARGLQLSQAWLRGIDARAHFGAAVDACLLVASTTAAPVDAAPGGHEYAVYGSLDARSPDATLGFVDGELVADTAAYRRARPNLGQAQPPWRSGMKHDARDVMELRRDGDGLRNGLGERVDIEPDHVFPHRKGGDLRPGADDGAGSDRHVLVPQRSVGQSTAELAHSAPRTWAYLSRHGARLDARRSRIYAGQPRFAVFGVGPYTFQPWKVCIPGLYPATDFTLLGPVGGKPVVLDDTCYFIGFDDEAAARDAHALLDSERARDVLRAFAFWDDKRPIKKDLLDRLSLERLALTSPA